jgi:hypothetical protein
MYGVDVSPRIAKPLNFYRTITHDFKGIFSIAVNISPYYLRHFLMLFLLQVERAIRNP